ncbi:UNVERIFIED_CONTAM: hypothetical protein HDU68_007822 [Siphonaria sp. JEL0065]|nr:hypothetical protein HDU68_007822 [Siphonaria sp. JEL0065]
MSTQTRTIAIAIDGSQESTQALVWVLENLVQSPETDSIALINAYPGYSPPAGRSSLQSYAKVAAEQSKKHSQHILKHVQEDIIHKKYPAMSVSLHSVAGTDAKTVICETVQELKPAVLVVGARGLGVVKRVVLGSVSSYLVHHAGVPVVVAKGDQK